jgi:hypothetical protein
MKGGRNPAMQNKSIEGRACRWNFREIRTAPSVRRPAACVAVLWLAAGLCVQGGIVTPLYVGNLEPVWDQYGNPLEGSYDLDPSACDRVEIRTAPTAGIIFPPSETGAAHPNNPLLSPDSVGVIGMNAGGNPGIFAMVFPDRPATGTKLFGRAYNAPSLAEATFYSDSGVVVVSASATSVVLVFAWKKAHALDPGDSDGDGLENSWEKELGTDGVATNDFDEDGMSDLDEKDAGTDPTDAASLLNFRFIATDSPTAMRVRFQSQPGMTYQFQETVSLVDGEQDFIDVGTNVTAAAGQYEIEILAPVAPDSRLRSYRVRLVPVPEP